MRRAILAPAVLAIVALAVGACSNDSASNSESGKADSSQTSETVGNPNSGTTSALKVLRVAIAGAEAPYDFKKEGTDEYTGLSIRMLEYVLPKAGYTPEYSEMSFENLIPSLDTGRADITLSVYHTPAREKTLDFIDYFNAPFGVITKAADAAAIHGWADLCGKTIASVYASTISDQVERSNKSDCPVDKPVINQQTSGTIATQLQAVKNGRAFGAIDDVGFWGYTVSVDPSFAIAISQVGDPWHWAIAAKKGSPIVAELQPFVTEYLSSTQAVDAAKEFGLDPANYPKR